MRGSIVNQVCTAADLIEGNFEDSFLIKDIIPSNDFGLGTFNHLNGEMIIYNGKIYRAKYDGEIEEVFHGKSPFIIATKFTEANPFLLKELNQELTKKELKSKIDKTSIYAIKIDGSFSFLDLRSNSSVKKPYPTIEKILKESNNFNVQDVKGTLVGFYFPKSFEKISTSGFHFHFIDEDKKLGGHVIDFAIKNAKIYLDKKTHFNITLPKPDF